MSEARDAAPPVSDMAQKNRPAPAPRAYGRWRCVLDLALVLWVLRVPVATTTLGWLILAGLPQAQDLFTEFDFWKWQSWFGMLWVAALVLVIWALPTHYAARILVDTDPATSASNPNVCMVWANKWLPRALGFLPFPAVIVAVWRSFMAIPTLDSGQKAGPATELALAVMALLMVLAAWLYAKWVVKRHDLLPTEGGALRKVSNSAKPLWKLITPSSVFTAGDQDDRNVGRLLLFVLFALFVLLFLVGADVIAAFIPRAAAIPFILGGWLPFLTYLSSVGRHLRAPLILSFVALLTLIQLVIGNNHTVRRATADGSAPVGMSEAVTWWKNSNCAASRCPRPIIIAGAGGASRAAFMLATTVGYLVDPERARNADAATLTPAVMRNRIFAISAVSGGAVGAVMVTAAFNRATSQGDGVPCAAKPASQWFGDDVNNWRDCLEALTSGDFLTADFLGFAFNDVLPWALRDRAAVLEDSWSNRFTEVMAADTTNPKPPCDGLECPFLSLRPRENRWLPLMVLNGTSEATGGRILTTTVSEYYQTSNCPTEADQNGCPVFVMAESFHKLLDRDVDNSGWTSWLGVPERWLVRHRGLDVKLKTAAHNSARFPLISPPGSVRNQNNELVARIVDGGYFENYGALAAKELALAIRSIDSTLQPLVIVVSNDPGDLLSSDDDAVPPATSDRKTKGAPSELATEVSAPLNTVIATRSAHGVLAVDQLRTALRGSLGKCENVFKIRVWPDKDKPLSMSWWESPLVQRQLHRQLERDKGDAEGDYNIPHLDKLWREIKQSSCSPTAPVASQ